MGCLELESSMFMFRLVRPRRCVKWPVCALLTFTAVFLIYFRTLHYPLSNVLDKDKMENEILVNEFKSSQHIDRNHITPPPTNQLINLKYFRFRYHDKNRCKLETPYLLILVHSSPNHLVHRKIIRKTWGSVKTYSNKVITLVFLLGETDRRIQQRIDEEVAEYGDIVQGDFWDSYRNLTYKHIMGYMWTTMYCSQTKVIMKTDDDIFIDIYRAIQLLSNTFSDHFSSFLACEVISKGSLTKRNGKWGVTKEEYVFDTYPEYCSGIGYFASPDVVRDIYFISHQVPFLWIDDVFVTGCLVEALQIQRTSLNVWFKHNERDLLKWLEMGDTWPPWMAGEVSPKYWSRTMDRLWNKTNSVWKDYVSR